MKTTYTEPVIPIYGTPTLIDALTGQPFWPLHEPEPAEPPSDTCQRCKGEGGYFSFTPDSGETWEDCDCHGA